MINENENYLFMHLAGGALTLYMLLVALRWFGPYLELEFAHGRHRWVGRITDPPLELARKLIGQNAGPFDWAPIVVMLIVWFVRVLLIGR